MLTRYALMTFGPDDFRYWQAHYCLLTVLAYAPRPCEVVMATDQPDRFAWFGDRVRVHALSAEGLAQWKGERNYFLRTLIQTLRLGTALQPAAGVAVYLDTDTAVQASLQPLLDATAAGQVAMDRREYNLFGHGKKGSKRLWNLVGGKSWCGVPVDQGTDMWNTGITAVRAADFTLVDKALGICDAMLAAGCDHYLTEQIAMSAVLGQPGRAVEVNPPGKPPLVAHYWGNKDGWNNDICQRLATIHLRGMGVDEAAAYVAANPIRRPLVMKTRWWHKALGVEPRRT